MPRLNSRYGTLAGLTSLALSGCGDNPVNLSDIDATARISGPATAQLSCTGTTNQTYDASGSTASVPIEKFYWYGGDRRLGRGETKEVAFSEEGTSELVLEMVGSPGVLDVDTFAVQVDPPPPQDCMHLGYIWGDPGHMWDGDVRASYELRLRGASNARWQLLREGEVVADLGVRGPVTEVEFPGPGEYTLRATIEGAEGSVDYLVGVRDGEPIAEKGRIGAWTRFKEDPDKNCAQTTCYKEFRYVDGETGYMTEPLFTTTKTINPSQACTLDRLILTQGDDHASNLNIFIMDHYGNIHEQITHSDGLEQDPDIHGQKIVFVNDSRTNKAKDELSIYHGGGSRYMSAAIDTALTGFNPAFSPGGERIALGHSPIPPFVGNEERRIKIVNRHTLEWRQMHTFSFEEAYGVNYRVFEGMYLDWHPSDEKIVYTVSGFGEGPSEPGEETRMFEADVDGSSIRRIADNAGGPVFYSPSGTHAFFFRSGDVIGEWAMHAVRLSDHQTKSFVDRTSLIDYCGPDEY